MYLSQKNDTTILPSLITRVSQQRLDTCVIFIMGEIVTRWQSLNFTTNVYINHCSITNVTQNNTAMYTKESLQWTFKTPTTIIIWVQSCIFTLFWKRSMGGNNIIDFCIIFWDESLCSDWTMTVMWSKYRSVCFHKQSIVFNTITQLSAELAF